MKRMLNTGDLCRIAGMAPTTFFEWCDKRVVVAFEQKGGHGNHRIFQFPQAVGLLVGYRMRRQYGAALPYVATVMDFIGSLTEEQMLENFNRGDTHLLIVSRQHMRLIPNPYPDADDMECRDVQAAYRIAEERLAAIDRRQERKRRGRPPRLKVVKAH